MPKPKEMTPEEFFKNQNLQLPPAKEPKAKKVVQPVVQPIEPLPQILSPDQRIELLAKGIVYSTWTQALLIGALIVLIAVLYPFPLNMILIAIAIGMDALAFYTMRKYMK